MKFSKEGERILITVYILVSLGLGLPHNYVPQVRGRKTGRIFSTPVNVLDFHGRRFLVAGRGRTQWVRNAEASGEVSLKKGRSVRRFRIRSMPIEARPEILGAYLSRFQRTVQRYFPVRAGSPPEIFSEVAGSYPVFELLPLHDPARQAPRTTAGTR